MKSPVLLLIFNRPETTQKVFNAIRSARPKKLYVSADGPRSDEMDEREKCEEARKVATSVNWPCEVKTLFRDENLGCKRSVSSGIDWFFGNEEEGIILEDDVLPTPSFFQFCDELLEGYREDDRISMISGCNFTSAHFDIENSYDFSIFTMIWGWASWRRSWKYYDVKMKDWPLWQESGELEKLSQGSNFFQRYWRDIFSKTHRGEIDTWDYQWLFSSWKNNTLSIIPRYNLTENIGFSSDATHTSGKTPKHVTESPPHEIDFPLNHPKSVERNLALDKDVSKNVFFDARREFMNRLRSILRLR